MNWPPRITALDLSLNGTGICHLADGGVRHLETVKTRTVGHQRLQDISQAIGPWAGEGANPHLVVIEGPSYGSQAGQSGHHERAGLWWITAHHLWRRDVPYAVISPNARAKYATGKGNANKAEVLTAAIKRWGHLVDIGDDNQADALILAAMAADHLDAALVPVPAVNRTALAGVTWPDLLIEGAAA